MGAGFEKGHVEKEAHKAGRKKMQVKYAALFVGGKVALDHFAAYGADRWRYLVAACALALAVALEALGARGTWHASYIVAFAVFTALNAVRVAPRENLLMLLATTAIVEGANRFLASTRNKDPESCKTCELL